MGWYGNMSGLGEEVIITTPPSSETISNFEAILLFIILPTIYLNLPSKVPLSPRWFGKTLGLE